MLKDKFTKINVHSYAQCEVVMKKNKRLLEHTKVSFGGIKKKKVQSLHAGKTCNGMM